MAEHVADENPPRPFQVDGATLHLVLILAVATGLRCWRLNHWTLWYDEVVTVRLAQAANPWALLDLILQIDATRAPLFPLVLMGWLKVFGPTDLAARSLVAILGILTVGATYGLGRTAFDERTGRWAAWLGAVCPPLVTYSQEVRMYALLVPMTVVSWWVFLRFRWSASIGHRLGYAALLASLMYTHPVGLFMVAAHGLAYLAVRPWLVLGFGAWVLTLGLAVVLVLPWVGHYFDHAPEYLLPRYPIRFLLSVPIEYIGGNSLTLVPLGGLILVGLLTRADRRLRLRDPASGLTMICWFVVPPVLLYGYSWIKYPIFGPARIHLFVAPAYLLLVARGLTILPRWGRLAVVGALLALTIHGLSTRTYAPGMKTDYRAFARWLQDRGDSRSIVVLHNPDPQFPYTQDAAARYYLEPAAQVILVSGDAATPAIKPPTGTKVYHASCFSLTGKVPPPSQQAPIQTFYGLTITRDWP